jgi:hypothetical protein
MVIAELIWTLYLVTMSRDKDFDSVETIKREEL